jgi:hypothetical protein
MRAEIIQDEQVHSQGVGKQAWKGTIRPPSLKILQQTVGGFGLDLAVPFQGFDLYILESMKVSIGQAAKVLVVTRTILRR